MRILITKWVGDQCSNISVGASQVIDIQDSELSIKSKRNTIGKESSQQELLHLCVACLCIALT